MRLSLLLIKLRGLTRIFAGTGDIAAKGDFPSYTGEEPSDAHVMRYLRAVVAWATATFTVPQHEVFRSGLPVEIYHVVIPRELGQGARALTSAEARIVQVVDGGTRSPTIDALR